MDADLRSLTVIWNHNKHSNGSQNNYKHNTSIELMIALEMEKQKQFTLDDNGCCYENSSIRLLFIH